LGRLKARIRKRDRLALAQGKLRPEQVSIGAAFAESARKSPLILPKPKSDADED
jgi:hypothetical protein